MYTVLELIQDYVRSICFSISSLSHLTLATIDAVALFNQRLGTEDEESRREHTPEEPHPGVEDEQ
jgi:hypothetical protein